MDAPAVPPPVPEPEPTPLPDAADDEPAPGEQADALPARDSGMPAREIEMVHCATCNRPIPAHQLREHETGRRHRSGNYKSDYFCFVFSLINFFVSKQPFTTHVNASWSRLDGPPMIRIYGAVATKSEWPRFAAVWIRTILHFDLKNVLTPHECFDEINTHIIPSFFVVRPTTARSPFLVVY